MGIPLPSQNDIERLVHALRVVGVPPRMEYTKSFVSSSIRIDTDIILLLAKLP